MASHRQCRARRWTSCMRAVVLCGTQICASSSLRSAPILPPPLPVSAITRTPSSCATGNASSTFFEMLRVGGRATVAARHYLAARLQRLGEDPRPLGNRPTEDFGGLLLQFDALGEMRRYAGEELAICLLHERNDFTRGCDLYSVNALRIHCTWRGGPSMRNTSKRQATSGRRMR